MMFIEEGTEILGFLIVLLLFLVQMQWMQLWRIELKPNLLVLQKGQYRGTNQKFGWINTIST
jgi:hypothetical protein